MATKKHEKAQKRVPLFVPFCERRGRAGRTLEVLQRIGPRPSLSSYSIELSEALPDTYMESGPVRPVCPMNQAESQVRDLEGVFRECAKDLNAYFVRRHGWDS